jgi:hypothetical protein
MESQKYKLGGSNDIVSGDGGTLATVYEKGSKLGLEPLDYGDPSLVGYWTFDEGTGTTAWDYSGNNAAGSWSGNAAYSAGKVGGWAGSFNGATSINVTSSISVPNDKTFVAWINITSSSVRNSILGTNGPNGYNGFYVESTGLLSFIPDNVAGYHSLPSPAVSISTWHFVALTTSGSNITLFLDGNSSAFVVSYPLSVTGAIKIGARGDYNGPLSGLIDDVRIYNRALSAAEISALYNGGK